MKQSDTRKYYGVGRSERDEEEREVRMVVQVLILGYCEGENGTPGAWGWVMRGKWWEQWGCYTGGRWGSWCPLFVLPCSSQSFPLELRATWCPSPAFPVDLGESLWLYFPFIQQKCCFLGDLKPVSGICAHRNCLLLTLLRNSRARVEVCFMWSWVFVACLLMSRGSFSSWAHGRVLQHFKSWSRGCYLNLCGL